MLVKKANKKRQTRTWKHIGAAVLSIMLVVALAIGMVPQEAVQVMAATADYDTTMKYTESLGDNTSTANAGRIWNDKTVYTGTEVDFSSEIKEGNGDGKIQNDSDFLIGYSALATSEALSGETKAPMDVVFVVDISGSMAENMTNGNETNDRIKYAVDSLNASIETLMELNEHTRVGVVVYAQGTTTMLELDHYTKTNANTPFFSVSSATTPTLSVNAKGTTVGDVTGNIRVTGGTNTQQGLYAGMSLLANATDTVATINGGTVQRYPAVVLLSDGQPTYATVRTSGWRTTNINWWEVPENDGTLLGPGSGSYYGVGMLTMMMGAYMKEEVNRNYNLENSSYKTLLYTVGVGVDQLTGSAKELAQVTLNPTEHYNSKTNDMAIDIRTAWDEYTTKTGNKYGTPEIQTDSWEEGNLVHPATNDIVPAEGDTESNAIRDYVDGYYSASDATALENAFADIIGNIALSAPQIPTEYSSESPFTSGYITYTDPIGEYMEVKDLKSVILAGQEYTQVSERTEGNVTTFIFAGKATANTMYQETELSNLVIELTSTERANGIKDQVLTIKVPAALIPIRVNTVRMDLDGKVLDHTNNEMTPIRVFYTVGMQDGVVKDEKVSDLVSADYIASHVDREGNVAFYSNKFSGNKVDGITVGDATATFDASPTNGFYYMQEDEYIYEDPECTKLAKVSELVDNETYYYNEIYYEGLEKKVGLTTRTGAQLKNNTDLIQNNNASDTEHYGAWYRPKGTVRLNKMLLFEGEKVANATETAQDFYRPSYDSSIGHFKVYLGNNGVAKVKATGFLAITKTVTAEEGLTVPADKEFEFVVDLNGDTGTYPYTVVDEIGTSIRTGTVADGGSVFLKADETAEIANLPHNTKYEVTEVALKGFTTTVTSGEASGTIPAGTTAEVVFNNHYKVETSTFPEGDNQFGVKKVLDGRDWQEGDVFVFSMTSDSPNAPKPDALDDLFFATVAYDKDNPQKKGEEIPVNLGNVHFTRPGEYVYHITEVTPEQLLAVREKNGDPNKEGTVRIAGMSYSRESYEVAITVTDNGDGTLDVSSIMTKLLDASGIPMSKVIEGNTATFTNTHTAAAQSWGPIVWKRYTDNSGEKPLTDNMFKFEMRPYGNNADEAPMPAEATGSGAGRVYTTGNITNQVAFPTMVFKDPDHVGTTFQYEIKEVIPEEAISIGDGSTRTYQGMTYDARSIIANVEVTKDGETLNIAVTYTDEGEQLIAQTFINSYTPTPVTLNSESEPALAGTKKLTGRTMAADEFQFVFEADAATQEAIEKDIVVLEKENTDDVVGSLTIGNVAGASGEVTTLDFGDITFTQPGTYHFRAYEKAGTLGGVTYDTDIHRITVVVTDNKGVLEATIEATDGPIAFENTYKAVFDTNTAVTITGTKRLEGLGIAAGKYFFDITKIVGGQDGETRRVVAQAETGAITFLDKQTYTEAGVYTYKIKEYLPEGTVDGVYQGVTYDTSEYLVTVTVIDDGKGFLKASTEIKKGEEPIGLDKVDFKNKYNYASETYATYTFLKELTGDKLLEAGAYEFKMTISVPDGGAAAFVDTQRVTALSKIVANDADGRFNFGEIRFDEPGDYELIIEEVLPAGVTEENGYTKDGVTYDTHKITATIRVVDDLQGNLVAHRINNTGGTTFTNVYKSSGSLIGNENLVVWKNLDLTARANVDMTEEDAYTFVLEGYDESTRTAIANKIVELPTIQENKEVDIIPNLVIDKDTAGLAMDGIYQLPEAFGDITFHKAGTYKFAICELDGGLPGMDYDTTARVITVVASEKDTPDGELVITTNDNEINPTFNNVYNPGSVVLSGHDNLLVNKVFTGRANDEWLTTDSFKFTLDVDQSHDSTVKHLEAGKIVMTEKEVTVTKENQTLVHFGNITFKAEGEFHFVIREVIPEEGEKIPGVVYDSDADRKVVVKVTAVTENDETVLKAAVNYDKSEEDENHKFTFTNKYTMQSVALKNVLSAEKVITGRDWKDTDSFKFRLKAAGVRTAEAISPTEEGVEPTIILGDTAGTKELFVTVDKNSLDSGKYIEFFEDITFKAPGHYGFEITEVVPEDAVNNVKDRLTYDAHTYIYAVTVVDDGVGNLYIDDEVIEQSSKVWNNVYTPEPLKVTLEGTKKMTGRELLETDKFTFVLSPTDSRVIVPMPEGGGRVQNNGEKITFGEIIYTTEGDYYYDLLESNYNADGVSSDKTVINVKVEIRFKTDGSGDLDPAQTRIIYTKGQNQEPTEFVFTNTYTTYGELDGKANLSVDKTFTGRSNNEWLDTDKFSFNITADSEDPTTVDAVASGVIILPEQLDITKANKDTAAFENIKFTKAGTYKFIVTETKGTLKGVTYDETVKKITVNVTDDLKGNLTAVVAEGSEKLTFTNTYSAEGDLDGDQYLTVVKNFTGRPDDAWAEGDQFTFAIEPKDSLTKEAVENKVIILPDTDEISTGLISDKKIVVAADGKAITITDEDPIKEKAFGNVHFTKAGVYTFTVREVKPIAVNNPETVDEMNVIPGVIYDSTPRTVTVTVTDNGDGTLSATAAVTTGTDLVFKNKYDPKKEPLNGHNNLHVKKIFTGRPNDAWLDTDQFTFTLEPDMSDETTKAAVEKQWIVVKNGENEYVPIGTKSLIVNKSNKAIAHFENIYFRQIEEESVYKFIVREVIPEDAVDGIKDGITYDQTVRVLAVRVKLYPQEGSNDTILRATLESVQEGKYENNELKLGAVVSDKSISFTNTYNANEVVLNGKANLKVNKTLNGRNWDIGGADNFAFKLEPFSENAMNKENVVMPDMTQIHVTSESKSATFDNITFKKIGTYEFKISEVDDPEDRISCDTEPVIVTVKVSDNGKGQLVAEPSYSMRYNDGLQFVNTYTPEPLKVSLVGRKVVQEANGTPLDMEEFANQFNFTVQKARTASTDTPNVDAKYATTKNAKDGTVTFEDVIAFTKAGTFEYEIIEEKGDNSGIQYDGTTIKATVKVEYSEATGKLTLAKDYPLYSVGEDEFVFTNKYLSKPATFSLDATKKVDVKNGNYQLTAGQFEFEIEKADDVGTPDAYDPITQKVIVKNEAEGQTENEANIALFDKVIYEHEGTYTYNITEVDGRYAGFTYDTTKYQVVVKVTYDPEDHGQLVANASIEKIINVNESESVTQENFVFNNTYDVHTAGIAIEGTKVLTSDHNDPDDQKPLLDGKYTFKLEPVNHNKMPSSATTKNVGGGFTFDQIIFTADDIGTYKYKVREIKGDENELGVIYDDKEYTVTITVETKDIVEEGELIKNAVVVTKDKTKEAVVFTNKYVPEKVVVGPSGNVKIGGTKELTGRELKANEFEFKLIPDDTENPMPEKDTVKNAENKTFAFGDITYTKTGTYTYTIKEVPGELVNKGVQYDDSEYGVVVEVTDKNHGGKLEAKVSYTLKEKTNVEVIFKNTYTTKPASMLLEGMKKSLKYADLREGAFEFALTPVSYTAEGKEAIPAEDMNNFPMPAKDKVTNGAYGNNAYISFGNMTFTKTGIYEYKLTELNDKQEYMVYDETVYTVKIKVSDEGFDGQLDATVIEPSSAGKLEDIVFNNSFEMPIVEFAKTQNINGKPADEKTQVKAGDIITYTMSITNKGTGNAIGIEVSDKTPDGLIFMKDTVEGGDKFEVAEDGTIVWIVDTLKPGETRTMSFKAEVPESDKNMNWSNIASMVYENNPDNPDPTPENPNPKPDPVPSNEVEVDLHAPLPTGDDTNAIVWVVVACVALGLGGAVVVSKKRKTK